MVLKKINTSGKSAASGKSARKHKTALARKLDSAFQAVDMRSKPRRRSTNTISAEEMEELHRTQLAKEMIGGGTNRTNTSMHSQQAMQSQATSAAAAYEVQDHPGMETDGNEAPRFMQKSKSKVVPTVEAMQEAHVHKMSKVRRAPGIMGNRSSDGGASPKSARSSRLLAERRASAVKEPLAVRKASVNSDEYDDGGNAVGRRKPLRRSSRRSSMSSSGRTPRRKSLLRQVSRSSNISRSTNVTEEWYYRNKQERMTIVNDIGVSREITDISDLEEISYVFSFQNNS